MSISSILSDIAYIKNNYKTEKKYFKRNLKSLSLSERDCFYKILSGGDTSKVSSETLTKLHEKLKKKPHKKSIFTRLIHSITAAKQNRWNGRIGSDKIEAALMKFEIKEDLGKNISKKSISLSSSRKIESLSLQAANDRLRKAIIAQAPYKPSPQAESLARGIYRGGALPKEFMDNQTHQHGIFENVYLGDLRGYLSVDPQFIKQFSLSDNLEDMLTLQDMTPALQEEAKKHLNQQIDHEGCSKLGIKYVLSATKFQPAAKVPADDWSRFNPDLKGLEVQRMQVPIDDDEFAWDAILPHLEKAFEFIDKARLENQPCLIHCVKGASRSVTILTAYLMSRCQVTMEQAFNYIKTKRTVADLKPSMQIGLKEFESQLNKNSAYPTYSLLQ